MQTGKIELKTTIQYNDGFVPIYRPLYPSVMQKTVQYPLEVGKLETRRLVTIGDIRAKTVTPKDTELVQIAAGPVSRYFKKKALMNQYRVSDLQSQEGSQDVVNQVLDEAHKQADEIILFNEGTSDGSVLNNGLYYSSDPHFSTGIATPTITDNFEFYDAILATATEADKVAGRKLIVFFGTNCLPVYRGLFETGVKSMRQALQEGLGQDYSLTQMPADITPNSANGWLLINLDQIRTHYMKLPSLVAQGHNEEKGYYWFNFQQASFMTELLAGNSLIRQAATISIA